VFGVVFCLPSRLFSLEKLIEKGWKCSFGRMAKKLESPVSLKLFSSASSTGLSQVSQIPVKAKYSNLL